MMKKFKLADTVGSQSFCEEGLSIEVTNYSLGTIRLFLHQTVEAVHFFADGFHPPDQCLLVNTDETATLQDDLAVNQNRVDRMTSFTKDELVDDIP